MAAQLTVIAATVICAQALQSELVTTMSDSVSITSKSIVRSESGTQARLQSFRCPYLSRHMEVWDEMPDKAGFQSRFGSKVITQLPDGCTEHHDTHPTDMLPDSFLQTGLTMEKIKRHDTGFHPALIPYPKSVRLLDDSPGIFVLSKKTSITLGPGVDKNAPFVAAALTELQKRVDEATSMLEEDEKGTPSDITLGITPQEEADPHTSQAEGYKLTVHQGQVRLDAFGPEGFSHGVATLQQLMPLSIDASSDARKASYLTDFSASALARAGVIPAMEIVDSPAFKWRGLHLDVSRHFFNASDVKKLLRTMAQYKLNRFHWHLTDDQGWRFPVPEYPELTKKGAGPRYKHKNLMPSSEGIEGSYTEQDIRDVLEYAKARNIQVIPEVDVPGHVAAAVAAYPELGNQDFDAPGGPQYEFGVHEWTLAPTKTSADFLEKVFAQIAKLFPDSEYIHVGGDEAPQSQWRGSSGQARKNWESFEGSNAQSYFSKKVSEIVQKHGKKLAGWDEIQATQGLPQDAVIFAWRGENELRKAVRSGRSVINADCNHLYLDHYQGPEQSEPKAIGGPLTRVKEVYEYRTVPGFVQSKDRHLVLGGQAELWSEYFPNWKQVEYMAFPRAIALAERLWSPDEALDYTDFSQRLQTRLEDLRHWGVNFHKVDV